MTILAAALGPDGVWIGSDGLTTCGNAVASRNSRKWLLSPGGRWAVGISGERAYRWALDGALAGHEWPDDPGEDGARALVAVLRGKLADTVDTKILDCSNFRDYGVAPLLASAEGAWRASSDLWALTLPFDGRVIATGCGEDFAMGAMHVGLAAGASAFELVQRGVEAACAFSPTCGGERWYHRMGGVTVAKAA